MRSKNIILSKYAGLQNHKHKNILNIKTVSVAILVSKAQITGNGTENYSFITLIN
jgi:hypothetical protein